MFVVVVLICCWVSFGVCRWLCFCVCCSLLLDEFAAGVIWYAVDAGGVSGYAHLLYLVISVVSLRVWLLGDL